ncbi:MAG: glycosyltransferase [Phycisphaerales bacterium]|nr:glycosyltransferase [Phycisphaerales bacterium]
MIRITHYISTLDPSHGGVVAHVSDLAVLTQNAGANVTIASPYANPHPANLDYQGGPTIVDLGKPIDRARLLRRNQVQRVLELASKSDITHLHSVWTPANIQIAKALRRHKLPYVITPHGMLDDWCLSYHPIRKRVFLELFAKKIFAHSRGVLYCAAGEQKQSEKWTGGSPGHVVPAAMDIELYRDLPGPDLARQCIPGAQGETPIILFLSRINHKKGIEVLIDAAEILATRNREFKVIIAGTGTDAYTVQIKDRVQTKNLNDHIHFAGLVRGKEKISLYQRSNLLALPTKQENFGLVLTESLAARTPVITTRGVDIYPELETCNGGLIVDRTPEAFADAIEELLDDPERCSSMGDTGRTWVMQALAPDRLADQFMKIYEHSLTQK